MVRKNPRIHIIENAFLKDLIVRGGHIAGVHLLIDGQDKDLAADRVILAAGGAGRMYPYTTNPPIATADGLAVAWRAGAQVADLEFYQFHPTAMAVGEHFLVSEAVRGEGAVLLDEHGHRYMKDIDPRAELAPRDVVARENFRVMQAQGGKPVMLDVSPMRRENPDLAEFLRHRFPTIDAYTRSLGFDWSKGRFGRARRALLHGRHPHRSGRPREHPRPVCGRRMRPHRRDGIQPARVELAA